MQYGKLENGKLIIAPKNYITEDGATICNFTSSVDIMLEYGFKEVVRAEKDADKEYIITWEETETQLIEVATERQKTPEELEREAREREEQFNKEFFPTSLGYISRTVHMKDGSLASFLKDILSSLAVGFPVIAYDRPDFTIEKPDMIQYQHFGTVTEQFLSECRNQFAIDFYGYNPIAVQQQESEENDV